MKVLRFGAVWCPGCIVMRWRWQKIEKELAWLQTEDYDYNRDKEMVTKYNIGKDIPIFVFLDRDGLEFNRMKGEIDRKDLIKFLMENKDK